jgi:hypothetical protein
VLISDTICLTDELLDPGSLLLHLVGCFMCHLVGVDDDFVSDSEFDHARVARLLCLENTGGIILSHAC